MEKKQITIASYSQKGHYMYNEDTWGDECVIDNATALLNVCKMWHKRSASTFNDYPFGGLFDFSNLSFKKQTIIIDESGCIFYGPKEPCDAPVYFETVKNYFKLWLTEIKKRLPLLRQARNNRLHEETERKKFEELSIKYAK